MKAVPAARRPVLLVVEADEVLRESLSRALGRRYRVRVAATAEEALRRTPLSARLDALVAGMSLPEMGGFELCRKLKKERPGLKAFILGSPSSGDGAREAFAVRADGFLPWPFDMETVRDMLENRLRPAVPVPG